MMTSTRSGLVNAAGESAINQLTGDASIFDMAAAGEGLKVSAEVEEGIGSLMASMKEEDENNAKFLLDIYFNEERSIHRPFSGFLMAWTNGGFAHGGGDEKVYFCPNKVDRDGVTKICAAPMPPNLIKHKIGICVSCQRPSHDRDFVGEVFFKLPMQSWAAVIERYFFRLNCNTDIRIGVMRNNLMSAAGAEQTSEQRGEVLKKVRMQREWVRYSLHSIIKDGSGGATLAARINAFLRA